MNIQIQTTTICNARCSICPYEGSWFNKNPVIMDNILFRNIVNNLKKVKNIERICLYLMNEPFTDKNIIERINIVKNELKFGFIEISTNAELLTKNKIDLLAETFIHTPYRLIVSVQGASRQQHRNMMKIDPEKVWNNVNYMNKKMEFRIQGCGIPEIECDTTERYYDAEEFYDYITKETYNNFKAENIRFFKYNDRGGQIEKAYRKKRNQPICSRLYNWMHILYNGDIALCCNDYNKEYIMGNILDYDNPEDFMKSDKFIQFMAKYKAQDDSILCRYCNMK